MTRSKIEWDVNASTSRAVKTLLVIKFALVGGIALFVGTSLLLALAGQYAIGTTMPEFVGILVIAIAVPILLFYTVLRTLAGSGTKRTIALYYFYDPAHPDRTVFDLAHYTQYVAAATVGLFGYLGAIFIFGFRTDVVLTLAIVSAAFCYFLWWIIPNRGRLDIESETLILYNRRLLTEGGSASTRNLLRGFSNDDRQTSLEDVIATRSVWVDDIVILTLRHRSGYAPTLVVVPPQVANLLDRKYGS